MIYFCIRIDFDWCDPKPSLCAEGTECRSEENGYNCVCKNGYSKYDSIKKRPYVEACEPALDTSFLWILLPVVLGIIIIQGLIFTLYLIRRKRKFLNQQEIEQIFPQKESQFPYSIDEVVSVPRPALNSNINPNFFEGPTVEPESNAMD